MNTMFKLGDRVVILDGLYKGCIGKIVSIKPCNYSLDKRLYNIKIYKRKVPDYLSTDYKWHEIMLVEPRKNTFLKRYLSFGLMC